MYKTSSIPRETAAVENIIFSLLLGEEVAQPNLYTSCRHM